MNGSTEEGSAEAPETNRLGSQVSGKEGRLSILALVEETRSCSPWEPGSASLFSTEKGKVSTVLKKFRLQSGPSRFAEISSSLQNALKSIGKSVSISNIEDMVGNAAVNFVIDADRSRELPSGSRICFVYSGL